MTWGRGKSPPLLTWPAGEVYWLLGGQRESQGLSSSWMVPLLLFHVGTSSTAREDPRHVNWDRMALGRESRARQRGVVSSILPVRGKAWGGVDGPCRSTPNRQLIFAAVFSDHRTPFKAQGLGATSVNLWRGDHASPTW